MYNIIIFFISILLFNSGCSGNNGDDPNKNPNPPGGNDFLEIILKPNTVFQTIHSFGASDAWSTQFVGKNWPIDKRNQIADLLFSNDFDSSNNPMGIGLSSWRFNIGAGSMSQGNNSGINDEWRRAESFINSNGYDWTAQEGQRWFVNAAKQRGVSEFIAFSNSPPVVMTKNGKAYSSGGSSANIDEADHMLYADFLVAVLENYKNLTPRNGKYTNEIREKKLQLQEDFFSF